jgi:hypothetical protein
LGCEKAEEGMPSPQSPLVSLSNRCIQQQSQPKPTAPTVKQAGNTLTITIPDPIHPSDSPTSAEITPKSLLTSSGLTQTLPNSPTSQGFPWRTMFFGVGVGAAGTAGIMQVAGAMGVGTVGAATTASAWSLSM